MGERHNMDKAVFLDRDGVINRLVFNPTTGYYESPHLPEEWELLPGTLEALKRLQNAGFGLFLVSNQPSYAKGKTTLENIQAIHDLLHAQLIAAEITFKAYYYCYHHPDGSVEEYTGPCDCRKPKPFFLLQARDEFNLEPGASWMVGDQDTDMECGNAAGVKTILVKNPDSLARRGMSTPRFEANDLAEAVEIILKEA
jgi:D-glycero-D-manno-heptose 1,7-bisphosphate phosphatase